MVQNGEKYDLESLLREDAAAQFLGFKTRTLQAWRISGGGPAYIKIYSRAVRYRKSDLIAWAESLRRVSTSDKGGERSV